MAKSNVETNVHKLNYHKNGRLKSVWQYSKETNNYNKRDYFYIPEWMIFMVSLFLLAILIVLLAGFIIFYTAPRNAFYGEDCSRRSCVKGLNMKCINKTCSCFSNQYYNRGCKNKASYMKQCFSYINASSCEDNKGFTCLDGVCKCDDNVSYWNGKKCIAKKAYKETCQYTEQCIPNLMLSCSTSFKLCMCDDSRYNLIS